MPPSRKSSFLYSCSINFSDRSPSLKILYNSSSWNIHAYSHFFHAGSPYGLCLDRNSTSYCKKLNIEIVDKNIDIKTLLKKAHCLLTYDSTSAVDAILEGVPVFALSRTMAEPVCNKFGVDDILNPRMPDRTAWCNWIAYQQWTSDEILNCEYLNYFDYFRLVY